MGSVCLVPPNLALRGPVETQGTPYPLARGGETQATPSLALTMAKKIDYVALAKERYEKALENQRPKFKKFNDYDYIFHSKLKKADPHVPSKVFNPIVWSFIETIITRMLAKKPTIAFKPREYTDKEQSQIMSDLFSYWFDKADALPVISDFIQQALVYGTAILKVDWYTSPTRLVKSYVTDPMTGEAILDPMTGQFQIQETPVVDYDDPRIQNVNIYDFFVDPAATTIENAAWVIYQYYTTVEELEKANEGLEEPLYNAGALKKLKDAEAGGDDEADAYERTRRDAAGFNASSTDRGDGRIKVWEMWTDSKVCIIGNESVVLRESENPYWHGQKPFIRYIDASNGLEFFGKGEIEPVEKMIHALNTVINQRLTNINQILAPIWKARSNVDEAELQFIPNNIIHVNDEKDAMIMEQRDVTASAFTEQGIIQEQIQRTLGVTDYVQGMQTPGQTKAEVEIKTSQANTRFAHKVMMFENMALKKLGEFVYELYQQFVTKDKVIRVVGQQGEKFMRLTPMDLAGRYDVVPESGSTLETDQDEDFRKFFNLAAYLQTKPYANQLEIDKELLERSGEKDPDRFLMLDGGMNGDIGALGGLLGLGGGVPAQAPVGPGADTLLG